MVNPREPSRLITTLLAFRRAHSVDLYTLSPMVVTKMVQTSYAQVHGEVRTPTNKEWIISG